MSVDMEEDTTREKETSRRILDELLSAPAKRKRISEDQTNFDPRFDINSNPTFQNRSFGSSSPVKKVIRFDPSLEEHNRKYALKGALEKHEERDPDQVPEASKHGKKEKKRKRSGDNPVESAQKVQEEVKPFFKVAQDLKERFTTTSSKPPPIQQQSFSFFDTSAKADEESKDTKKTDDPKSVVNFFAKSFGVGESNFFFLSAGDERFSKVFTEVEEFFLGGDATTKQENYAERKEVKRIAKGKVKNYKVKSRKNFRKWKSSKVGGGRSGGGQGGPKNKNK